MSKNTHQVEIINLFIIDASSSSFSCSLWRINVLKRSSKMIRLNPTCQDSTSGRWLIWFSCSWLESVRWNPENYHNHDICCWFWFRLSFLPIFQTTKTLEIHVFLMMDNYPGVPCETTIWWKINGSEDVSKGLTIILPCF